MRKILVLLYVLVLAGFSDVAVDSPYAAAVDAAAEAGLFGGIGGGLFAPDENMTHGMFITVLARLYGEDTRLDAGYAWHEPGANWARQAGIADIGQPYAEITRDEMGAILAAYWDFAGLSGYAPEISGDDFVSRGEAAQIFAALLPNFYVYMTLEGFSIGHGFFIEPTRFSIPAGTSVYTATRLFFAQNNIEYDMPGGFLGRIYNIYDNSGVIPDFIASEIYAEGFIDLLPGSGDNSLGMGDYASWAGWMYRINHADCPYGMASRILAAGDVVRWQFSLVAGPDLGVYGWSAPFFTQSDRTALIRAISRTPGHNARNTAMAALNDILSPQIEIDAAIRQLNQ